MRSTRLRRPLRAVRVRGYPQSAWVAPWEQLWTACSGRIRWWVLPTAQRPAMIAQTERWPCDLARSLLTIDDLENALKASKQQPPTHGPTTGCHFNLRSSCELDSTRGDLFRSPIGRTVPSTSGLLLSAHAVDEEQAAVQGCLSHGKRFRVFGGVIPALQLLHGRKLDHDDALASRPLPFWHLRSGSSHEVPSAITSYRCTC